MPHITGEVLSEQDEFYREFSITHEYQHDWDAVAKYLKENKDIDVDKLSRGPDTTFLYAIMNRDPEDPENTILTLYEETLEARGDILLTANTIRNIKISIAGDYVDASDWDDIESGEAINLLITSLAALADSGKDGTIMDSPMCAYWVQQFFAPYKLVVFLIDHQGDEYMLYGVVPFKNKQKMN